MERPTLPVGVAGPSSAASNSTATDAAASATNEAARVNETPTGNDETKSDESPPPPQELAANNNKDEYARIRIPWTPEWNQSEISKIRPLALCFRMERLLLPPPPPPPPPPLPLPAASEHTSATTAAAATAPLTAAASSSSSSSSSAVAAASAAAAAAVTSSLAADHSGSDSSSGLQIALNVFMTDKPARSANNCLNSDNTRRIERPVASILVWSDGGRVGVGAASATHHGSTDNASSPTPIEEAYGLCVIESLTRLPPDVVSAVVLRVPDGNTHPKPMLWVPKADGKLRDRNGSYIKVYKNERYWLDLWIRRSSEWFKSWSTWHASHAFVKVSHTGRKPSTLVRPSSSSSQGKAKLSAAIDTGTFETLVCPDYDLTDHHSALEFTQNVCTVVRSNAGTKKRRIKQKRKDDDDDGTHSATASTTNRGFKRKRASSHSCSPPPLPPTQSRSGSHSPTKSPMAPAVSANRRISRSPSPVRSPTASQTPPPSTTSATGDVHAKRSSDPRTSLRQPTRANDDDNDDDVWIHTAALTSLTGFAAPTSRTGMLMDLIERVSRDPESRRIDSEIPRDSTHVVLYLLDTLHRLERVETLWHWLEMRSSSSSSNNGSVATNPSSSSIATASLPLSTPSPATIRQELTAVRKSTVRLQRHLRLFLSTCRDWLRTRSNGADEITSATAVTFLNERFNTSSSLWQRTQKDVSEATRWVAAIATVPPTLMEHYLETAGSVHQQWPHSPEVGTLLDHDGWLRERDHRFWSTDRTRCQYCHATKQHWFPWKHPARQHRNDCKRVNEIATTQSQVEEEESAKAKTKRQE